MIRVRFAPSPTGYLHIGGARTALFNWMYARSQAGQFVLRIEDTDQQRSQKEFEEEILASMKWLGLDWDELYYQSQRFDTYREHAEKLLAEGKAYRDGSAIILKMIPDQDIKIFDLIRGEITFNSSELKDQVLMKSDGSPAYSFCCVVDDALMEISHVVRGEDHISNTPKQMMIYQALGLKPPKWAHMPLIMGEDGARLSKRNGAVAVSDYRKQGFLPEALVNYLMLLGWSPGENQEVIDLKSAVKKFSIKKINKAAAIFSMDKLRWLNNQYIKQLPTDKLSEILLPLLGEKGLISAKNNSEAFKKSVNLYKGRLATLQDFTEWADYMFTDKFVSDDAARAYRPDDDVKKFFSQLAEKFAGLDAFDATTAHDVYKACAEDAGRKPGDLVQPLRMVLTGKSIGPGLFQIIEILGKEKVVKRLQHTGG